MNIVELINYYGFPIVAVFFLAYFIYYLYNYIVNHIKPKLGAASATLIELIDRVRMLDNDLIRLRTKVKTLNDVKKKQKDQYNCIDKMNKVKYNSNNNRRAQLSGRASRCQREGREFESHCPLQLKRKAKWKHKKN